MLADATAMNVAEKRVVLADGAVDYDILDRGDRCDPRLFRPRRLGRACSRPQVPERRIADPAAGAYGLRGRRARNRRSATAGLDDFRDRRCRPDGRRAGRYAGRGLAPDPGARFPPHQHGLGPRDPGRGEPAGLGGVHRGPIRGGPQQLEKLGVAVWTGVQVTGIDADGVWIGPRADPRPDGASGPQVSRRRRWRSRSASPSTAPVACWSSPS